MDVGNEQQPSEGEVIVFTEGGAFLVKGSVLDVSQKFATDEWPTFELAETSDKVVIRSSKVVALRGGARQKRGQIGLTPGNR